MDSTPKLQRKSSLSLSSRLHKKRHSASPQSSVKSTSNNTVVNERELKANCDDVPRSPSMYSMCSDGGIECTPPHKKSTRGVADVTDGDFSPNSFDSSFSPSYFLSQTMLVDSPEVGWKWKRHNEDNSSRTPDSAYAADSSFTSAGSSSTEVMVNAKARCENYKKRRARDALKDQEFRRLQNTIAEEKLKERCAKLQEQLRNFEAQILFPEKTETVTSNAMCSRQKNKDAAATDNLNANLKICSPPRVSYEMVEKPRATACDNNLDDFFNDSDDCFLLAATQEVELKIKTSPTANGSVPTASEPVSTANDPVPTVKDQDERKYMPLAASNNVKAYSNEASTSTTTKEKRSSFYMKFLEDDCIDDWFISLDDDVLQETQSKKARTSLQRYKSMPTNSNDIKVKSPRTVNISDPLLNESANSFGPVAAASSEPQSMKIKRHSSSHALTSPSTNYRGRHYHLKM